MTNSLFPIESNILFSINNQSTVSHTFKKESIKKIIRQSSKLFRAQILGLVPDLFTLICSTLPEDEHQYLAEQFALAILNVGEWWP
jgi:hypothetical protein